MASDLDTLTQALQQADAAGDTAGATRIAAAIRAAHSALAQPSVMDNFGTPTAKDVAKGAGAGLVKGLVGSTIGAPGDLANLAGSVLENILPETVVKGGQDVDQALKLTPGVAKLPTTDNITSAVDYKPATESGKYAKNMASGAASMLPGGASGWLTRLLAGLGIGAGEHAAQQLGGGVAEGGANALADTVLATLAYRKPRAVAAAQDLVRDVDPSALSGAATKATEASQALGTPTILTQGLDTPSGMTALTQAVMQAPGPGAPLRRIVEGQYPVARSKVDDFISSLSPLPTDQTSANLALAAGDKAIGRPGDIRTQIARDLYRAAGNDTIPGTDLLDTVMRLGDKRQNLNLPPTSDSGRAMTQMERKVAGTVQGYPNSEGELLLGPNGKPLIKPTPVLEVDTLKKEASAKAAAADKPEATGADIAKKMGQQGNAQVLRDTTRENSAALAAGQDRQRRVTEAMVEPMNRSTMTDAFPLSQRKTGKGDFDSMTSALEGNGSDISKDIDFMASNLKKADPKAFPVIAKKWLEGKSEAADRLVGGRENPDFINSFVDSVAGPAGSNQRANLLAVVRGVATSQGRDPAAAAEGANRLFDALQVVARERSSVGRVDTSEVARAAGANPLTTAGRMASVIRPFYPLANAVERHVYKKTYTDIADALTSPDGLAKLERIAQFDNMDRVAGAARGLLRGQGIAAGED